MIFKSLFEVYKENFMEKQIKIIGKIEININKNASSKILSRVHATISNLFKNNIKVIYREDNEDNKYVVIIKLLEIGGISDKHMREAFRILFAGIRENDNFVKFIDEEKELYLPDDTEECIHWFIIEK